MKKLLVALVALTTASAFSAGKNMVRFYGFTDAGMSDSFDVSMKSDDAEEAYSMQNIALNYARAFGQWQVGVTYKTSSSSSNASTPVEMGGTTMGISGYYNLEEDLGNTCYFALHYLTHTASETGGYSTSELMEDLGEDDTATSIVLEYGHRWTVGSAWGFDLTYAPNITYAMNSYSWDVSANDDAKGAAESALAWNWIKFDVLF